MSRSRTECETSADRDEAITERCGLAFRILRLTRTVSCFALDLVNERTTLAGMRRFAWGKRRLGPVLNDESCPESGFDANGIGTVQVRWCLASIWQFVFAEYLPLL
jgi:hypothetical protein